MNIREGVVNFKWTLLLFFLFSLTKVNATNLTRCVFNQESLSGPKELEIRTNGNPNYPNLLLVKYLDGTSSIFYPKTTRDEFGDIVTSEILDDRRAFARFGNSSRNSILTKYRVIGGRMGSSQGTAEAKFLFNSKRINPISCFWKNEQFTESSHRDAKVYTLNVNPKINSLDFAYLVGRISSAGGEVLSHDFAQKLISVRANKFQHKKIKRFTK
jgi:hypothetical protein